MADYLYNGHEFPALPDRDKTVYPSAIITNDSRLLFLTAPVTAAVVDEVAKLFVLPPETYPKYTIAFYDLGDGEWKKPAVFPVVTNNNNQGKDGNFVTQAANVLWTDTPIYNEDGTLYLAASDPVPVTTINPSALMQGFFVGDAIKRMRGVKPEQPSGNIVGYLYGGVGPLPDVNEAYESFAAVAGVDVETVKSIAPYAVLFHLDTATLLHLCTKLPYVHGDDCWMPDGGGIAYFIVDGKAWTMASSSNNDYGEDIAFMKKVGIVWTSHNILTADGSTYLAASEPVPVYE